MICYVLALTSCTAHPLTWGGGEGLSVMFSEKEEREKG